jgi:hypothetical protein
VVDFNEVDVNVVEDDAIDDKMDDVDIIVGVDGLLVVDSGVVDDVVDCSFTPPSCVTMDTSAHA